MSRKSLPTKIDAENRGILETVARSDAAGG